MKYGENMKSLVLFTIFAAVLLLGSCQNNGYRKVILKHPETLDFKECEASTWTKDHKESDECIRKYKEQGYQIWGER
ncbi:MAG: hypothetical protein CSB24_01500 [Deltaproteobacteria bacterium]|nr:MAG: hypothetical protein CSB24_01500 [Deltaproteobacteria bacterium]